MFIVYALLFLFVLALVLAPIVLMLVAAAKVHQKAGYPGWSAIVPYYSQYVQAKIGGDENNFWHLLIGSGADVVLSLFGSFVVAFSDSQIFPSIIELLSFGISVYVLVFQVRLLYNLARAFGQGAGFTVGLVLLPVVFYPLLAWGQYEYVYGMPNNMYASNNYNYGYAEQKQAQAYADYNNNLYGQSNPFQQEGEYSQNNSQNSYSQQPGSTQPKTLDKDILNGDIF